MRAYTKQTFILESTKYTFAIFSKLNRPKNNRSFSSLVDSFEGVVLVFHPGGKSRRGALDEVVSREVVGWKRAGTVAALAGPKIGFYRVFGSGNSRGRWVHVGCKSPFRAFKNAIGGPI